MKDDDRLNSLLYEQLKDQLNLHAAVGDDYAWYANENLFRTWLQAKRRKVLN